MPGRLPFHRACTHGTAWAGRASAFAVLVTLLGGCAMGTSPSTGHTVLAHPGESAQQPVELVRPVTVPASKMTQLPAATTYGKLPAAPRDSHPRGRDKGDVLHPTVKRVIYTRPGGPPLAMLPVTELSNPTWVPIVESLPGWDRVLLPTRPNRSTGWIYLNGGGLRFGYSPYRIKIDLARYQLTVFDAGRRLGTWKVAIGAPGTPTPTGRTFLLASLAPRPATYSPLILPLGTHSRTLSTFGGGPGTVALHGWPDPGVFGHAASHGCVRVPAGALHVLSAIPLGSSVLITR
jgi:lipoprotein-anchoring transpeptidase ErfK/SrfK